MKEWEMVRPVSSTGKKNEQMHTETFKALFCTLCRLATVPLINSSENFPNAQDLFCVDSNVGRLSRGTTGRL